VAERTEIQHTRPRRSTERNVVLFYVMLAAIPITILVLMFSLARHG